MGSQSEPSVQSQARLRSIISTNTTTVTLSVPWETINEKLPFQRNKEAYAKRKEMWTAMDVNGNGYLSLAEVTKGVRDVIAVDELFDAIPAINRSFHHCKNVATNPSEHGDDYIEFREFRLLLKPSDSSLSITRHLIELIQGMMTK